MVGRDCAGTVWKGVRCVRRLSSPVLRWALRGLLFVGLSGCTRAPEEDANRILFSFWGTVQQEKAEQELIRAFEEAHPEIKVDTLVIGGARYAEKIQAMFVGDVAPDVVMVNFTNYNDWASRGVLLELTDDFREISAKAELMPIARRVVERDGKAFGLPVNAHGYVTYYNIDALQAAGVELPEDGLTWEFIEEVAPRLSRRYGDPSAPTDYALLMPMHMGNTLLWQRGVRLFDDLYHPRKVTVNTPEAVEAIEFLRRLIASGCVVPAKVTEDQGTFQLFRDGKVAFYFDGRWRTPEFVGRTRFAWNVAPYPRTGDSGITLHGGTVLAVAAASPRKEAARKFVRFYASPDGAAIAMRWQRNVPVYRELAFGEEFLSLRPPENILTFSETMEDGASLFHLYAPGVSEVSRIVEGRIEQALSRPGIPAKTVIDGLEEELNRWLQKMKEREVL